MLLIIKMLFVIKISVLACVEGAKLSFVKENPTPGNNNTCATLTCEQIIDTKYLYVQKVERINIDQGGSILISIYADSGHKLIYGDMSLTSLVFTKALVSVKLAIQNVSICSRGNFLCEVTYINGQYERNSDISIIRPNLEPFSLSLDNVHVKIDSLTEKVFSLKASIDQVKKRILSQDISLERDFPQGWTLAFRSTPYINKPVFDAYRSGTGIPENVEPGCKQVDSDIPCRNHYRNNEIFSKWTTITKVVVVLYERNVTVGYMLFDGRGTDYMNWYNKKSLEYSSWLDLRLSDTNYFSIEGFVDPNAFRQFYVNRISNNCPLDQCWFVAIDNVATLCYCETTNVYPMFLYAKSSTVVNWKTGNVGRADVMAIYVK